MTTSLALRCVASQEHFSFPLRVALRRLLRVPLKTLQGVAVRAQLLFESACSGPMRGAEPRKGFWLPGLSILAWQGPVLAMTLWLEVLGRCRFGGWNTFGNTIAVEAAES
ncbi:hypothetical protein AB0Q95_04860 [Streptomyces sp. NPDC059900]|uniref:hypothetical protein n=1 Tax=Streptomyces sp. NPDC059900 TaxID=3155816 RepID=UPI00341E4206